MYVCMYVDTFSDDKVETKRRAGTIYKSQSREKRLTKPLIHIIHNEQYLP